MSSSAVWQRPVLRGWSEQRTLATNTILALLIAVAGLVAAGETERVRAYCETDCLNLYALYLRWAHLSGRTDAAGHDRSVLDLMDHLDRARAASPHLGRFVDAWRLCSAGRAMVVPAQAGSETIA